MEKEVLKAVGFEKFSKEIDKEWFFTDVIVYPENESIKKGEKRNTDGSVTVTTGLDKYYTNKSLSNSQVVPCLRGKNIDGSINNLCIYMINGKLNFIPNCHDFYNSRLFDLKNFIDHFIIVKIKSYKKSAELFGYSVAKKKMMDTNEPFNIDEICNKAMTAKDGNFYCTVSLPSPNGKSLRFITDDLEFIYPNIKNVIKGYNKPMDRTLKAGRNIKIVKKNSIGLAYGTTAKVEEVVNAGYKKFCIIKDKSNKKTHAIEETKIKVIK